MARGEDGLVRDSKGNILYIGTVTVGMRFGDFAKNKEEFINLLKKEFAIYLQRKNTDELDVLDVHSWRITDVKEQ